VSNGIGEGRRELTSRVAMGWSASRISAMFVYLGYQLSDVSFECLKWIVRWENVFLYAKMGGGIRGSGLENCAALGVKAGEIPGLYSYW
jgi:hypothetical protein